MKITKITPEQIAKFGEWSEKWIEIGLSTEPADFERATAAALRGYELANLKRPMIVLRMSSPYGATVGGAMAWALLRELKETKKKVRSQVRSQVWSQVGSQVRSQVGSQVWSQVESQVGSQVRSQVRSQVWSQVESQVESQVGSQVESQVESQVGSQVRRQVGSVYANSYHGSLWASWGAYVSFFRDVMGWDDPVLERFKIDEDLIRSCGWVWWHENVLAISDRPSILNRDERGRLHSASGQAIAYRDGWALYSWHGTTVPAEWIENKSALKPETVLKTSNMEQRRAGCEILGWDNMLRKLNSKMIDKDADPQIGELVEVMLPGEGNQPFAARFLRVECGTGRKFAVGVPPTVKSAIEAQSWMQGLSMTGFQIPEIRT